MDCHKICFIICQKENECADFAMSYLEKLSIPEGYDVDLLTNVIGESFLQGLEECFQATDALYKVVLRPNVCMLYPDVLAKILEVFTTDEEIGIVAFQGYSKASREALFWKDMDVKYSVEQNQTVPAYVDEKGQEYDVVDLFEPSIFVIKGDVALRSDLFDKDILWAESIAMEMKRAGKKIVVPHQKEPWCYSDTRYFSLAGYYDVRDIFIEEYEDVLQ